MPATADYMIIPRTGEPFAVRAASHRDAARIALRRLYGRTVVAERTTGSPSLSGQFRAYTRVPRSHGGGLTSVGDPIHVG